MEGLKKYCDMHKYLPIAARVFLALLFIIAGWSKLASLFHGGESLASQIEMVKNGLPFLMNLFIAKLAFIIAMLVELGAGIMLVVGYKKWIAASSLAVFTVIVTLAFHLGWKDNPNNMIMFFKNMSIVGGLLLVVSQSCGKDGIDCDMCRVSDEKIV